MLLIGFCSCESAHYTIQNNNIESNIDFRNGKWLLNEIDAPNGVKSIIANQANEKFKDLIGNNYYYKLTANDVLLQNKKTPLNPDISVLKELKKGLLDYDFFINIKVEIKRDDLDGIKIVVNDKYKKFQKKISYATIEVYEFKKIRNYIFKKRHRNTRYR